LRAILTQCAWAASKTKNTYLNAKYHSLVGRRGKKRALIAVGHKILIMAYYILKTRMPYKELGKDYLSRRREDRIVKNNIKRLRDLGYEVELKKVA
jgi:transposase